MDARRSRIAELSGRILEASGPLNVLGSLEWPPHLEGEFLEAFRRGQPCLSDLLSCDLLDARGGRNSAIGASPSAASPLVSSRGLAPTAPLRPDTSSRSRTAFPVSRATHRTSSAWLRMRCARTSTSGRETS